MQLLSILELQKIYQQQKETSLFGKWVTFEDIKPNILKLQKTEVSQIGTSEKNTPIYTVSFGRGKRKILIWSQMHGNESTGTKAVFDLLNVIENSNETFVQEILNNCTIKIIPMLNPDGSKAYTRVNANNIDLNRDAVALQAKESKLLRSVLDDFKPQFCFNLHDQRTIFGVEGTANPATISFLAPSEEETRALTDGRKQTMNVIVAMNLLLQQIIPNFVGRYTDEFYPTATGDNFQKLGYNTILIEAGHFPDDYNREEARKFNFFALLQGIYHVATAKNFDEYKPYFDIPNNQKSFFDVIHRNENQEDRAFQYIDKIIEGKFVSKLEEIQKAKLNNQKGHNEIVFGS